MDGLERELPSLSDDELLDVVRGSMLARTRSETAPGSGPAAPVARDSGPWSAAFAMLWSRHHPRVVLRAAQMGAEEPEDVAMEACARVTRLLKAGAGPRTNFVGYVMATVRSVVIDRHRATTRRGRVISMPREEDWAWVLPVSWDQDPAEILASADSAVMVALRQLPIRDQQVLWWLCVEGRRTAWVATALGLTPNATYALAFRARASLRQRYAEVLEDRAVE